MRKIGLLLLLLTTLFACETKQNIKVLQLNIWQEGTVVKQGYEAVVNEIASINADFVMLSEVRNYNDSRFCDRIVASLKEKGKTYYSFYSYDSGLLSKYPIIDSCTIFPENGDHGSMYKLIADIGGQEVAVYTAHLDYLSCAYYDVRGYDGNTWSKLDAPLTDIDQILAKNVASFRDDAIMAFIKDADKERAKGRFVFLGGDFNEPSHLDWTHKTKNIRDHHGVVIPWTVTTLLEENGYLDAYRVQYPDPIKNPGFTYPADCEGATLKQLSWAPEADERERIDFIFYTPVKGLELNHVAVHGPTGSICRAERVADDSSDPFVTPLGVWPTDHKGVIAEFTWTK